MAIPFTQYMRPSGRPKEVSIELPADIEALADRFIDAGGRFEAEVLTTDEVSLTAVFKDESGEEGDVEIEVVPNGPGMKEAVARLVARAVKHAT